MNAIIRHYKIDSNDLTGIMSSWENASKLAHPFLTEKFLDAERYNIPNVYLPNTDTWVADFNGVVIGFIALMGNEVAAIFVEPEHHGTGVGLSLMNKAQKIHGDLEVEVFNENSIGLKFYSSYGFSLLTEKIHALTGHKILRLKFTDSKQDVQAGRETA